MAWRSYLENFLREFVLSHRLCNGRDEPHSSHGGYVCCAWFCPVLVEPKQLCTKRATTRNECPGRSAKREDLSSKNLRGICPESPVVACARFKTTLRLLPFLLSLSLSLSSSSSSSSFFPAARRNSHMENSLCVLKRIYIRSGCCGLALTSLFSVLSFLARRGDEHTRTRQVNASFSQLHKLPACWRKFTAPL